MKIGDRIRPRGTEGPATAVVIFAERPTDIDPERVLVRLICGPRGSHGSHVVSLIKPERWENAPKTDGQPNQEGQHHGEL